MELANLTVHALDFHKDVVKTSFDLLHSLTAQSSAFTDRLLATVPSFPEEGKKFVTIYFDGSQKGLDILKQYMESYLKLDWTAKDAPVKSLETMDTLRKKAFQEAAKIQKEIIFFGESQKGLAILRKHLETHLELDWTAKDAPIKSLEAMETFSKEAIKEAAEILEKMKALTDKATGQHPKKTARTI